MTKKELNIEENDGIFTVRVNPLVYSMDVIYSAAYVLLDKAYIVLDGDPEKEILVKIKPKAKSDNMVALEFNNELINYSEYKTNFERNKEIRQTILQRALLTNDPALAQDLDKELMDDDFSELDDDIIDDPEGIAVPWEEKYGDKGADETENGEKNEAETK